MQNIYKQRLQNNKYNIFIKKLKHIYKKKCESKQRKIKRKAKQNKTKPNAKQNKNKSILVHPC
jgi:hypothetical protein